MDLAIENTVKACPACQLHQNRPPLAELHPWSRLHIDHAGPFMEKLFLIVNDAHSKWLEVVQVSSTASSVTIAPVQTMFVLCMAAFLKHLKFVALCYAKYSYPIG